MRVSELHAGDLLELISAPDWIRDTYKQPEARIDVGEVFEADRCDLCSNTGIALRTRREKNNLVFHPTESDMALFRKVS